MERLYLWFVVESIILGWDNWNHFGMVIEMFY